MKTDLNIINICLSDTPMQEFIRENRILGRIISAIPEIPFEKVKIGECIRKGREDLLYENKKTGAKHTKITIEEKCVYVSKVLKKVAEEHNSDFLILDGFLHYFNGAYWEKIDESVASDCISMAAEKAGFLPVEAQQENNKKKLLRQFIADYKCPPIQTKDDDLSISVNLRNGTLKYNNGEFTLRDFQKEDMLRYQLSFDYDPDATCPQFDEFLDYVLPEKQAQDVLMEMIGYCFIPTRKLKLERSMMLYGEGANGKGVIYELVKEILGKEHVTGFSMAALSFDANTRVQLSGKLLNYSSELGGKCNPDMIKKLISGEDVEVKTLYKDVWTMQDYTCKFMFNTNSLPKETEANVAFFRRWIILPFDVTIAKEKRDKKLPDKLKKELPGIFNRVISGIKRLLEREDFTESELVNRTLEEYKIRSNTVLFWVKKEGWFAVVPPENTERKYANVPHIELSFLYQKYIDFCRSNGMHPANNITFNERIRKLFYVQTRSTNNATWVFCDKPKEKDIPVSDDTQSPKSYVERFIDNLNEEK